MLDGSWLSEPRLDRRNPGEMEAVPTAEKARWAPVPVWTCAENLAPSGLDSRTAHLWQPPVYDAVDIEKGFVPTGDLNGTEMSALNNEALFL